MTEKKSGKHKDEDFDDLETASDLESEYRTKRKIYKSRKKPKGQKGKPQKDEESQD